MRRLSLTTRLTLSHLLATLAGLLFLGGSLLALVEYSQRSEMLASLQRQAEVYAAYAAGLASDTQTLSAQAAAVAARFPPPPDVVVRIFAANGSPLIPNSPLGQFPSRLVRPYLSNALFLPPVGEDRNRRYAVAPIAVNGQVIGVVETSQGLVGEQRLTRRLLVALLGAGAIASVGAFVLGTILARTLIRPLHHLGHVATSISGGNLATRSPDSSKDEIGQLARQINTMANQLQARLEEVEDLAATRQQFYRSVSHELRTPLTAIRGMAENLEDDATPDQQAALQVIQTEAGRLQRLVEELLQPGEHLLLPIRQKELLDFAALVNECCVLLQPRAGRGGVALHCAMPPVVTVRGDRDRLKQVVLNLLDNALKWTPAGGEIRMAGKLADSALILTLQDSGPGIPSKLRDRVWQRGVRGADGGQGLGLALVREVVEAHGGSVSLLDQPGTLIRLTLPLAK